jgi:hypothetical protein
MSAPRWLRDAAIVGAILALGGWAARVEAKLDGVDDYGVVKAMTEGLARLACLENYNRAYTAGLPCDTLTRQLKGMP